MKTIRIFLISAAILSVSVPLHAATASKKNVKANKIYHKGWIDFNKNGIKDVYEDPRAPLDARIEDEGLDVYEHGETCYN